MQAVLDCAWDHLLPAMRDDSHIHDDGSGLKSRLDSLSVPSPAGHSLSSAARGKTYRLESNIDKVESIAFRFDGPKASLSLRGPIGEMKIEAGADRWIPGIAPLSLPLAANPSARIAARGAWTSPDTYTAAVCYVETPFIETITCRFTDDRVIVERQMNVSFGPAKLPTLSGRAI